MVSFSSADSSCHDGHVQVSADAVAAGDVEGIVQWRTIPAYNVQ